MGSALPGDAWAVVTGSSSGIGAAFARALRAQGRRVVLVARRQERLEELSRELGPSDTAVVALDLTEAGAASRLLAELDERKMTVDLLVNNAGKGHSGRFHQEDPAVVLGMIDLNVRTLVDLTRAVLPRMLAARRGGIINVVSMAAFQPVPYLSVYAATKAFVLSFTEGVASEIEGSGVVLQALCPGNIPTEFQQVAGTQHAPFTKTPPTSAEAVVQASLRGLAKGQLVVIPGLQNRLTASLQGLVPRAAVRRIASGLFRPAD